MAETAIVAETDLDRLQSLIDLFDPVADKAEARPICWITGGNDCGTDYCHDCARWMAKHLRRHDRDCRHAQVDGGWDDRRESDHISFCGGCGHLLGYSLSEYAYGEALEYWSDDVGEHLTPTSAFEVRALLEAALEYRQMVPEALAIGVRAATLLSASNGEAARG